MSEWFGHRTYPVVTSTPSSLSEQSAKRCPFLSRVKEGDQECIKTDTAKGVCTISCASNGPRQDWVVCPYRMFDPDLIDTVALRLYGGARSDISTLAAPTIARPEVRKDIVSRLRSGKRVLVYFDQKIGGEISLSATPASPEMAFDVTLVELRLVGNDLRLGRFGILEVQTMDFHGSYRAAVKKLTSALDLHRQEFASVLQKNQWWAGEGIEGPNIANVFKRTFYQMMFKFKFGEYDACAGTVLTLPESVWDSWQPFLGRPRLLAQPDGTFLLAGAKGRRVAASKTPAWILVFDFDFASKRTPNPLRFLKTIGVTAEALNHYALSVAPEAASGALISRAGIYLTLQRRLREYWPDHSMGLSL